MVTGLLHAKHDMRVGRMNWLVIHVGRGGRSERSVQKMTVVLGCAFELVLKLLSHTT